MEIILRIINPNPPTDTTETPTTPKDIPPPDNRKVLYLQGVYATSNDKLVENIFDDDASTKFGKLKKEQGQMKELCCIFKMEWISKK